MSACPHIRARLPSLALMVCAAPAPSEAPPAAEGGIATVVIRDGIRLRNGRPLPESGAGDALPRRTMIVRCNPNRPSQGLCRLTLIELS